MILLYNRMMCCRQHFQELEKGTQDMIILYYMQAHRRNFAIETLYGQETKRGKTRRRTVSEADFRKSIRYYFLDSEMCRMFFFFVHDIGRHRFNNLIEHYDREGGVPRIHGRTGKTIADCSRY